MPQLSAKVRAGRVAGRQRGRITRAQLAALGIGDSTIRHWVLDGYLYHVLPRVYAVGHAGRSEEADLFAAILYAGPGAALAGMTAGLSRGLVKWRTQDAIDVTTPRRIRSLPADHAANGPGRAIVVRGERNFKRHTYHGIPTVSREQIVLAIAATGDLELVRFVLAQLDFMRCLNVPALERLCRRGVPGSTILHEALANQQPLLAHTRSRFEIRLIQVCEQTKIPLPELNVKIGGVTPDALWRDAMVVVECDGELNHGTWRQRKSDTKKEMVLRRLGFLVVRYVYEQLDDPWAIHADLTPILEERAGRAAA
jgi:hypothetical protein